jgi:apolipoprotein N-acyltransferase
MSKYVKNGANIICIITNDGWWKKTPGHKQHMQYARLRAIETRTWVARSANTGISCFIDPSGKVFQPQPYDTKAAIKMNVPVKNEKTFFVRYGDLLSKGISVLAILLVIWVLVKKTVTFFQKRSTNSHG